jgi:hypothetical protein
MSKKDDSPAKTVPEGSERARRPYRAPRLARLGTLTDITATVDSAGMNDMGTRPFSKT